MAGAGMVSILVADPVLSDGETAVPTVPDALSRAQEAQRTDGAAARIGIAAGEEGGEPDPRQVAAALCAYAEPGQVLVSQTARSLALAAGGHEFREIGALELEGVSTPVRTWEFLWQEPQARTRVRLCGPLEVEVDGRDLARDMSAGQAETLLCFLLTNRERPAHRDELIEALWRDRPPKDAPALLRPVLSRLRRAVAPATLEGRERLQLVLPDPVWVDVEEAARAVKRARIAAGSRDWGGAREHAETALELLRPGFLPAHDDEWVAARRRELEELELEALEWMARSGLAQRGSELGAAERASRELIARAPFRETGYRFLMEALGREGNVAEALRVYEDLRVLLRDELGAAPAAEVQELHGRLLAGEATAPPESEPAASARERPARVPLPTLLAPSERTAFVARERELELLHEAWRGARSGSRRLVLLAGEPGIGKTRLLSEFAREAHGDGTVLYAGCQEEALLSYQPFVEALRHYARSAELDEDHLALGPGAGELARLIPELAATAPGDARVASADPEMRRYLMFDAVSAFLAQASSSAPVALLLDDLHWADKPTLDLLRHVMRAPHDASLLIVGTYREAEIGTDHPLAAVLADLRRDRLFERVTLDGLDESGVGALISSHAGHQAPSGLVGTVHDHTEGNPFFVEEVMRHLIETGVLFERDGRWVSALTPDEVGVPEGVKEVLARRLGRLSDGGRTALAQAAVLGRRFGFAVLSAMTEGDDDGLIAALEEAVGAQLVVESADASGPAYAFTHALVRETLYGSLSGPRRQRLHARAAAAIEEAEGQGDAQVAALAVHHRLAGSAGDAAKAIDYSLRAGGRAAELSAWESAAAHWDGALGVMARAGGRQPERARLLVALADLMVVTGDLGRQISYLEEALALYEELSDDERAAQVHSRLGMAHSLIDSIYAEHLDIRRAFRHFDAARAVLEQGPPRKSRGHLEVGVSTALTYGLRMEPGLETARRSMEIAERLGDDLLWASAAQAYGWHALVSGRLGEGFATEERAFEVADREQRPFLAFMGSNIRGQFTWGLGAPDEAQAFFERLLHLPYIGNTAYRQEIADGVGRCHVSRGEIAEARRFVIDANPAWISHSLGPLMDLWDGRLDQVESLAAGALETSRRTGNRWDEWASQHLAARVRYLVGDLEGAAKLLEQALDIVVDGGARYFEMWVRPDLARACAESGRVVEARVHADRCREVMGAGEDWRGTAGHVALADAVVLAFEDRMGEAEAAFGAAHATFERYRLRGGEADALHQWGRALARAGAGPEAAEKLEAAVESYRSQDAGTVWVDRVEDDLRRMG